MTILEQYQKATKWTDKVSLMELLYLSKRMNDKHWTLNDTAAFFSVSIGLVSENLKLANELNNNPELAICETRQKALDKMNNRNTHVSDDWDDGDE